MTPYKHGYGQIIDTDAADASCDRGFIAHQNIAAADVTLADTNGVHLAKTNPAINVAATCVVAAASAETDILTVSSTVALGADANVLSILLTTAEDDVLAVSKNTPDTDGIINISLAKTTASYNTASKIQVAVRSLASVNGVSVAAFTCAAGGDWDTAAVATGEDGAVDFSGGLSPVDVITTGILPLSVPRNITATSGGTSGDIKAVQVTIVGTNYNDEVITEVLPIFTANSATTVTGSLAFKTVTSISIPAHDGLGATTEIGFGTKFGIPYLLESAELVILKFFNKAVDSGTVTADATDLEKNVFALNGTADGAKEIDLYMIV